MASTLGTMLLRQKIKRIQVFYQRVMITALVTVSQLESIKLAQWSQVLSLNPPNAGRLMKSLAPKIGKVRASHQAHTDPTQHGMGDFYGTGYKNPMGKMRSDSVGYRPVTRKQMGTPPKSVV